MLSALQGLEVEIMTPESRDGRASNICFAHPEPGKLVDLAAAENILFWGDDGRIRMSIHLFNDEDDIATLVEFLTRNRAHLV